MVEEGGDEDGPEAADKGVGEEGAEQGRQAGSAAEVCEGGGCLGERHVQLLGQVAHHVGGEPHHGELLRRLVCCINPIDQVTIGDVWLQVSIAQLVQFQITRCI